MLLHCYPCVREAGYLARLYSNGFVDVSLAVPLTGAEALELAPSSKVLFATDTHDIPSCFLNDPRSPGTYASGCGRKELMHFYALKAVWCRVLASAIPRTRHRTNDHPAPPRTRTSVHLILASAPTVVRTRPSRIVLLLSPSSKLRARDARPTRRLLL